MHEDVLDICSFVPLQGTGKRRRLDELRPCTDDGHDFHGVTCPELLWPSIPAGRVDLGLGSKGLILRGGHMCLRLPCDQ
jgi:hypothetical protein